MFYEVRIYDCKKQLKKNNKEQGTEPQILEKD